MKIGVFVALAVLFCAGCGEESYTDTGWEYIVEFPNEFVPTGTDVAHEISWTSKDGTVEVHHRRLSELRSKFSSLSEFANWIEAGPDYTKPNFYRAPNGLDIAVDSLPNWTQIAISDPKHTKHWEIILFGINSTAADEQSVRILRERAIGAILSGRSVRD